MNAEAGPSRVEPRKKKKKAKTPRPTSGPIPAPYLATAPSPVSSISRTALNNYVAPVNNRLVLPSTFSRTKSTPDLRDVPAPAPTGRRMYAANLAAPPLIMPGGTSATPRIQELGAAPARRGGRRRSEEGLRGMSQANQSMASLGVLGRIMENDPEPRRRRRVVREERQMPVVSSREEGRALGLARGASMRRLSVWDNLPDSVDAPPPFVLRLAPIAQPDDPAPPFTDAPRSPPPTFEQATANLPASTDQPVSNTPSNLLTNPPIPATSSHLDMPRSRPTSILSIPSSPETHYASAPESPVETASEDEPDEREDRRAWNADISAGYSLLQRVEREAARRRVSREARSTPQGITEGLADEDGPVNVSATAPEVEATMEPVVAADETLISAEQHAQRNTVSAGPSDSAEITNAGTEGSELAVAIAAPPEPVSMLPSTQAPVTLPDTPLKPISSPTSLFPVLSATGAEDAGTLEALPEQSVIPADPVQSTEDDERGPGSVGLANRGQRKGTYDGVIANKEEEPVLSPAGASRAAAGSPKTLPLSKASKPEAPTKSRPTRVSEDISSSTANSPVASQPPVSSPSKAIPISPNAVLPSTLVALRSSKQSPQLHGPAAKEIKDESSRPSPQPAAKAITEFSASSAAPNAPIETPMLAPVAEEDGRSQVGSDIAITPTPTRKLTRGKAIRRSSSGLSISESRRAPESPRQPLFGELSDWRKAADLPEPRRQSSNVQSPPLASPTWGKSAESTPVLPPHREAALKRRELVTKSETPPRPEPLVDLFSSSDVPYHSPPPIISPELYQLFGEEPVAESSAQAAARIEQEQILATIQKTWGEPVKPKKPPPPPPPLRRTLVSTTVGANLTPRRSIIRTADSPVTPRPIRQLSQGSQDRPIVPTRRPPPPPPKPKELEAPTLPQRPAPTYTRRDSAFSESTSSDSQPVRPLRPRGPRPAPPNKRWGRIFLPEEKIPIRPLSERTQSDTVSQRPETARSMSEQNIRSPIEYTDLDVLVSRLEGSGREYEGFSQITAFLGPGKSPAAAPEALATLLPAMISVDSRRVTGQGKVKLKLSLLGVRVTKCPICLGQFKKDEKAVLLPECGHVSHEECARKWFREDYRCFVCRVPLSPESQRMEEGVI